ncbi:MAG: DUF4286 family protein [Breznakibacter sp.]|jgi:hypothetical protein|nr:DUF4286 family protein [Breznakibacter sp.]
MFVFNTTFVIEGAMVDVWDQWMSVNYFPLIKEIVPGAVVKSFEVMVAKQGGERNFSVQWSVATPDELSTINRQSNTLLKLLTQEYGERCLSFSTILQEYKYKG